MLYLLILCWMILLHTETHISSFYNTYMKLDKIYTFPEKILLKLDINQFFIKEFTLIFNEIVFNGRQSPIFLLTFFEWVGMVVIFSFLVCSICMSLLIDWSWANLASNWLSIFVLDLNSSRLSHELKSESSNISHLEPSFW